MLKKTFRNFVSNLFLLISSGAILLMCVSRDVGIDISVAIRWDIFLALIYITLVISSFFRFHEIVDISEVGKDKFPVFFAMFLESIAFLNFYYNLNQGTVKKYIESLGMPSDIVFAVLCIFIALLGFYSVYIFSKWFLHKIIPHLTILIDRKIELLATFIIYIVSIIAIIRANFYYEDDIARATEGYQLTGLFGRYISTFFSTFIHGNTWLTDISPLPQIIAVMIMAVSGIILLHIVNRDKQNYFLDVLSLVPFGLSPYFLSCIVYKYDAPYMAMSVFFSIIPLLYKDEKPYKYAIATFAGTLLMCATYQASSGVFPMIVVLLSFFMWKDKIDLKHIFNFILSSVSGYVLGLLFFRIVLVASNIDRSHADNYVNYSISLGRFPQNVKIYFETIYNDCGIIWSLCIIFILITFIAFAVKESRQKKIISICFAVACVALVAILSFGTYMFFNSSYIVTRAMYGFGICITLFSLPIVNAQRAYLGKFFTVLLSWLFIVFSFTYGNALYVQKEYTDFRIEQVITDLKNIDFLNDTEETTIQISGGIGYANNVKNMITKYPILGREISCWSDNQLINYYGLQNVKLINSYSLKIDKIHNNGSGMDLSNAELPIVADNIYHTIKAKDHYILIILK